MGAISTRRNRRRRCLELRDDSNLHLEEARSKMSSAVIKKMIETRHSSAIATGDVRPGMGPLRAAPKYLIVTLLLAGLPNNAVMVLVVLPRLAHALNYDLSLGDLYDQIAKSRDEGHGYRVDPNMGKTT